MRILSVASAVIITARAAEESNVYSSLHDNTDQALYEEFAEATGIKAYEDLADPAFAGQICMRSSSTIEYLSLPIQLKHVREMFFF